MRQCLYTMASRSQDLSDSSNECIVVNCVGPRELMADFRIYSLMQDSITLCVMRLAAPSREVDTTPGS